MAYTLYNADGTTLLVLNDGIVDKSTTSLSLVGKNVSNFGQDQNQNFVLLLENFASRFQPVNPQTGQLWYDRNTSVLRPAFYDGTNWRPMAVMLYSNTTTDTLLNAGGINFAASQPGDFWFNKLTKQLHVVGTDTTILIGPEQVLGFGTTKMSSTAIADADGVMHPVIEMMLDGEVLGILSSSTFQSTATIAALGFPYAYRGITLTNNNFGAGVWAQDINATNLNGEFVNGLVVNAGSLTADNFTTPAVSTPVITNVGSTGSSLTLNGTDQLNLTSAGTVIVSATGLLPAADLSTLLGTAGNRWASVYTTNLNAGSSTATGLLTGSWTVPIGSSFVPGSVGNIDIGSASKYWGTVWTKSIDPIDVGSLKGHWTIDTSKNLSPVTDLSSNLGAPTYRWNNVYTTNISAGSNTSTATLTGQLIIDGTIKPTTTNSQDFGASNLRWNNIYAKKAIVDTVTATSVVASQLSGILNLSSIVDNFSNVINRFDIDTTLANDSDNVLSTQKATKTYIDRVASDFSTALADAISNIQDELSALQFVPPGSVFHTASSTAPSGYLIANGSLVALATYPALFSAIGYAYGGSGSHFNLPDLRGEFIRGLDLSRGVDSGRTLGSFQNQDIGSHQHHFNDAWLIQSDGYNPITGNKNLDGSFGYPARNADGVPEPEAGYGAYVNPVNDTSGDGGTNDNAIWTIRNITEAAGGSDVHPRNVALTPIIKF